MKKIAAVSTRLPMYDVIEYQSSAVLENKRKKKKPLLSKVYVRGITIPQAQRIFDIIYIYIYT
jgi:hypothetical protein